MPTYQYACTNSDCGNRFELVQAFTDPSVTECPVCGQRVRKVYGSVGVVFKGSGFYRNDSRSGSEGGSGDSEAAAAKPNPDAPAAKPADTPAAASTPKTDAPAPAPAKTSTPADSGGSKGSASSAGSSKAPASA